MTDTRSKQDLKLVLANYIREVWSNGAVERCDHYLAEAYTIHHDPGDAWDGQVLDAEGFKTRVRVSRSPFPDQRFDVRDMIREDSKVVATWLWSATHTGDLPGFPATGQHITMSGATVYSFDSRARITGHWQISDRLGVYQQLQKARRA